MKLLITLIILLSYISIVDNVLEKPVIQYNSEINLMNIDLPDKWHIEYDEFSFYNFIDENNTKRGWLLIRDYDKEYGYSNIKRNHASLLNEEIVNTPIGMASLYTLDVDNGTASSHITGTHIEYRAIIKIKDKAIYVLQFSKKDKSKQTKNEFIDILKSLNFK